MLRRRLAEALDWRLRAVTTRLDAVHDRVDAVERRVIALDQRFDDFAALLAGLDRDGQALAQTAADAAAARAALELRVQPVLRALVDEEPANRRRLFEQRGSASYEDAFTDPDPLVSVTLATVGRTDVLLERALPSLLEQSHANLEVIVIGDAAPPEVGEAVRALGDARVTYANLTQRLIAHEDPARHRLVGSTMARNEAARRARGRWLVHFDDDDHLRPNAVATLLELARESRAEVAYGGFEPHDPGGTRTTGLAFPPKALHFAWPAALVHAGLRFFERELAAVHLELPGDMYMLERMLRAGVRFAMLEEIVLDYFPALSWRGAGVDAPSSPLR